MGVAAHPIWSVPELRSILIEQRQANALAKEEDKLKGLTKMTLQQPKVEAENEKISIPPTDPRTPDALVRSTLIRRRFDSGGTRPGCIPRGAATVSSTGPSCRGAFLGHPARNGWQN